MERLRVRGISTFVQGSMHILKRFSQPTDSWSPTCTISHGNYGRSTSKMLWTCVGRPQGWKGRKINQIWVNRYDQVKHHAKPPTKNKRSTMTQLFHGGETAQTGEKSGSLSFSSTKQTCYCIFTSSTRRPLWSRTTRGGWSS